MAAELKKHFGAHSPLVLIVLGTAAACALFLGKAVHIDDTLFIRAAAQIQKQPLDFYGFSMNWYGTTLPMIENFDNPPLASYYLTLVAAIGGWSEPVLHLGFILPAVAAVWGIFVLARRLNAPATVAAAVAGLTPVFMVSATTLMCDVMLLALWVWAVVLFEQGLEAKSRGALIGSGLLAGMAFLTKFTGLALVPLLAAYGLFRERRWGAWVISPFLPLLFVAGYEWLTFELYGKGLLLLAGEVSAHAAETRGGPPAARLILGLIFLGGCFLPVLLYAPLLCSMRACVAGTVMLAPLVLAFPYLPQFATLLWEPNGGPNWVLIVQATIFLAGGLFVLFLTAHHFWRRRDAIALLLLLWVGGTFIFATGFNWTLNGRSLLPMAPAVGILIARHLTTRLGTAQPISSWRLSWPMAWGAILSLILAKADYNAANASREAATRICADYERPGRTLWFQGHWGFQHYMEKLGGQPLERGFSQVSARDIIVVPSEAVNLFELPTDFVRLLETRSYKPNRHFTTLNTSIGAGFYADTSGPFPFAVGTLSPEAYYVFEVIQPISSCSNSPAGPLLTGTLARQFEIERSIRAHERLVHAHPDKVASRLKLASLLRLQRRGWETIAVYESILAEKPSCGEALERLAWIRATDRDERLRSGAEAVRLAESAAAMTAYHSPRALATLAAARAECGDFEQAAAIAGEALELVTNGHEAQSTPELGKLVEAICEKRAFRE